MKIWIDAQLSPAIVAAWINRTFENIAAESVRSLGLRDASDECIFKQASKKEVVVMSKDYDFIKLIEQYGPPPRIIWIACGNTSNNKMKKILSFSLPQAKELLENNEIIVEISDKQTTSPKP